MNGSDAFTKNNRVVNIPIRVNHPAKEAKTLSETLSQTSNLTKLLFMNSCYEVSTCQKFNSFKQQSVN